MFQKYIRINNPIYIIPKRLQFGLSTMKFAWAFLIIIVCIIPFLVGAGFGLDALLGYCSSNSDCRNYEVCKNRKCTDECGQKVCDENEYCALADGIAICKCQAGFIFDKNLHKCDRRVYCLSAKDCDSSSLCQNTTCIDVCREKTCGPLEVCEVNEDTEKPVCVCQVHYRRHPGNFRCVKRCINDEDCDATEACNARSWCDTPCVGTIPPHTRCVPVNHKATYQCERCYRPDKSGHLCELDRGDASCLSGTKPK